MWCPNGFNSTTQHDAVCVLNILLLRCLQHINYITVQIYHNPVQYLIKLDLYRHKQPIRIGCWRSLSAAALSCCLATAGDIDVVSCLVGMFHHNWKVLTGSACIIRQQCEDEEVAKPLACSTCQFGSALHDLTGVLLHIVLSFTRTQTSVSFTTAYTYPRSMILNHLWIFNAYTNNLQVQKLL
jgi:hypothetical protein